MAQDILRGIPIRATAKATGLNFVTVWRHVHGLRRPKGEHALLYERVLGVPRSQLRPDLWPPDEDATPDRQDEGKV